ncbi:MAG: protein kinase, partial [Romboutsia sp.]|nr:protein kinase [Romboutsia sp.]
IGTLKYLNHPNIVKVIDTVITHKYIYLVLKLAPFSLQDLIHNHKYQLNLNEVPRLIYSLFDAMAYYFNKNILHLDIKPANILVFNENLWELTDFGLAKQGYCNITPNTLSTNVVTLMYRPINILLGDNNYDSMADIWAMGCVLYEIYTKTNLFDGYDELYMIEQIITILGVPTKDQWPQVVKLEKWSFVKRFEKRIPTGITHPEITSRPLLLDLLNTIFDYSNFGEERNSDHITKILTHPYFNEINGGRINYTRLTCLESLYDYNSKIGYYTHKEKLDRTYYYSRIINEPVYNLNILFLSFSIYDRYKTNELEKNKIKITKIRHFVTVLLNLSQKTLFIDNIDEEEEYPYNGYENYVSIEDNIVDVLDWKIYVPTSYDFMIMEITNYTILQRSIATTILFILYIYADINNLEMSTLSK